MKKGGWQSPKRWVYKDTFWIIFEDHLFRIISRKISKQQLFIFKIYFLFFKIFFYFLFLNFILENEKLLFPKKPKTQRWSEKVILKKMIRNRNRTSNLTNSTKVGSQMSKSRWVGSPFRRVVRLEWWSILEMSL